MGVQILPLTPALAWQLQEQASKALNGTSGRCTLQDVQTSCFASETCGRKGYSDLSIGSLLESDMAFVAVAEGTGQFVGCLGVNRVPCYIRDAFRPYHACDCYGLFIHTFCVDAPYRGCGAGKQLMHRVLQTAQAADPKHPVYLTINTHRATEEPLWTSYRGSRDLGAPCTDSELSQVMNARVERLLKTYRKCGFLPVGECRTEDLSAILLVYR